MDGCVSILTGGGRLGQRWPAAAIPRPRFTNPRLLMASIT